MTSVILDSQAVSVLAERRKSETLDRARSLISQLVDNGALPLIPATVIAETRRGRRSAGIDHVLNSHQVISVDRRVAEVAGDILETRRLGSEYLADAVVAAVASLQPGKVFIITSDPKDLDNLISHLGSKVTVIGI